jgi:CheY-like chemotaxis protein
MLQVHKTGYRRDKAAPQRPVLIVEDDANTRKLFALYLSHHGYRVIATGSGEQGLYFAHESHPAAILLDVLLPDMDGWEVLSLLKAAPSTRDIPVVIVSILERQALGFRLGAVEHLVKPVDRQQLLTLLRRCMVLPSLQRPPRLLLVESEARELESFSRTLEHSGFDVIRSVGKNECLALAQSLHPDAIVMDFSAAHGYCHEVIARLRADPQTCDIPIRLLINQEGVMQPVERLTAVAEFIVHGSVASDEEVLTVVEQILLQKESEYAACS